MRDKYILFHVSTPATTKLLTSNYCVFRGGLSDVGALSKDQVWGPRTITMCPFTLVVTSIITKYCCQKVISNITSSVTNYCCQKVISNVTSSVTNYCCQKVISNVTSSVTNYCCQIVISKVTSSVITVARK